MCVTIPDLCLKSKTEKSIIWCGKFTWKTTIFQAWYGKNLTLYFYHLKCAPVHSINLLFKRYQHLPIHSKAESYFWLNPKNKLMGRSHSEKHSTCKNTSTSFSLCLYWNQNQHLFQYYHCISVTHQFVNYISQRSTIYQKSTCM